MNEWRSSNSLLKNVAKGLAELLFFMPIWLTAGLYLIPSAFIILWCLLLLAVYVVAAAIADRRPVMRIASRWLISLVLAASTGLVIGGLGGGFSDYKLWIAAIVCGIGIAEQGAAMIRKGWAESFHTVKMGVGVLAYMLCIPFSYWFLYELADLRIVLALCGIIAVLLGLYILNDRHLSKESVDGSKSRTLVEARRRNRWLLVALSVFMLVLAAFRQIQQWIEDTVLAGLRGLFARLGNGEEPPQPPPDQPPQQQPEMPPMERGEPAQWLVWLEQIVKIVVTILIIAAALFLLYWLVKRLAVIGRNWLDRLLQRQSSISQDEGAYTDEIESLMSLTKWRDRMADKLKSRRGTKGDSEPGWDEISEGKERMRWLYRRWLRGSMRQGYEPQPYLTPQEVAHDLAQWRGGDGERPGGEEFVRGYASVRYGEAQPGEEQLEGHRRWVEEQISAERASGSRRRKSRD
jgi:hypothetical protein